MAIKRLAVLRGSDPASTQGVVATDTDCEKSEICEERCWRCGRDEAIHTPETRAICDRYTPGPAPDDPGSPLGLAAADYDRIGAEIDALADLAKAARERGDTAEGERLGAQVRALVAGHYLQARERYAALLSAGETA
jgi:hypothetical protein